MTRRKKNDRMAAPTTWTHSATSELGQFPKVRNLPPLQSSPVLHSEMSLGECLNKTGKLTW